MGMWQVYAESLRRAEETWQEGDIPAVVTAVATAANLDPQELHDRIESCLVLEAHDAGYEHATWFTAWSMRGYPNWQEAPGENVGHLPEGA
jgi:hypothetical protein